MVEPVEGARRRNFWFSPENSRQLKELVDRLNATTAIVPLTESDVVRYAIQQLYQEQFGETT